MHTIRERVGSTISARTAAISSEDINHTLGTITRFAWLSALALFASYLYFIGAITFSVIKQESLAQNIKTYVTDMGKEELRYLELQKRLTAGYAIDQGFVTNAPIAYTVPASGFAWNINVRE